VTGRCENGNELSGSIKSKEFLDWLNDCQLHNKDFSPKFGVKVTTHLYLIMVSRLYKFTQLLNVVK
jgi:hypothetical protein